MKARPLSAFVLTVVLSSCGGRAPLKPNPDPQALGFACADAYVIGSRLEHPASLEVWNESGSDVRLALDGCAREEHLGWVRAGARADLRLPATLVGFPEGLRLHAYGLAPDEGRTTYAVDPGAQVVRLVIPRAPMGG